jgi:hypothetical protein
VSSIQKPAVPKYRTSIVLEIEFEHDKLRSQRTEHDVVYDFMDYVQNSLATFIDDFPRMTSLEFIQEEIVEAE